jgi:hypothetical protein
LEGSTSRNSSVVIATGYGLEGLGSIPGRGKIFLSSITSQTVSGAHPASYPMRSGGSFPEGNTAGT